MREIKFIILTSPQSFNYFLPLYLRFHLDSLHHHPDFPYFCISTQFPCIPTLILCTRIHISFLAFRPLFSAFPTFRSPIPHFPFNRQPAQFVFFLKLFQENSCFSSKTNAPIIIYIIYGVISVITKNYLPYSASSKKSIICEV